MDSSINNATTADKYKRAGQISDRVLAQVLKEIVPGKTVYDVCVFGDELMEKELESVEDAHKGIAFPTCTNPNQIPAHLAPCNKEEPANMTLKEGDVVNVMLGVHVDGFPSIVAETIVVGQDVVTGKKADLMQAAHAASEAAIAQFQIGKKNWDVTTIVDRAAEAYGMLAVDSMLTHNQERDKMYGDKEVIINPSPKNRTQVDTVKFEEGEVYGLDILVSTGEGKVQASDYRATLYKLTGNNYNFKMKMSTKMVGELKEKSRGPFPVNIREMEEPARARGGLAEPSNHRVVLKYDIMTEKEGEYIAQVFTTVGVTKEGVVRFTHPGFDSARYKSDKTVDVASL